MRAEQSVRLLWLDVLKGIGIILVVIGHIYSNRIVIDWIYSFHMSLFFLAGGYVYKEKPILTDIKKRIQTIVITFFLNLCLQNFFKIILHFTLCQSNQRYYVVCNSQYWCDSHDFNFYINK